MLTIIQVGPTCLILPCLTQAGRQCCLLNICLFSQDQFLMRPDTCSKPSLYAASYCDFDRISFACFFMFEGVLLISSGFFYEVYGNSSLDVDLLQVGTGNLLRRDSVLKDLDKDQLHLWQMPECLHNNLKNVMMTGFSSAKSLIELTSHIVRNALALACMTLDTARGCCRRTAKTGKCQRMSREGLEEAQKALEAVKRCIEGIVPSSNNLKALEPCSQCGC
jgi:hypothetical protein